MGQRPVTAQDWKDRPSWKLKPPHDALTQALVVSGFASLPTGRALFLEFGWSGAGAGRGAWLKALAEVAPVTDADGRDARTAALAFTYTGLEKMNLLPETLKSFAEPFREGMYQEDRLRRLGDKIKDRWQPTVLDGGPRWSANVAVRHGTPDEPDERASTTPVTVHALLMIYEKDEEAATAWANEIEAALAPHGVAIVHRLPLDLRFDEKGIGREHFGFADGLSQPVPYDEECLVLSDGKPVDKDSWHGIPLGDILLGHMDSHREKASGPVVPAPADGSPDPSGLEPNGAPEGFLNFGYNGSYMVVRELKQDVAAFWRSMEAAAERIRMRDPDNSAHVNVFWLADRVVGRDMAGNMLCPAGVLASDQYGQPQNAFGFKETDPQGAGCPRGSHVRRANPRDGLAKDLASRATLLEAANNHRILRRGRKYGTTLARGAPDDGEDRGLLFVCLNTDIARQFEFIQQVWLLNSNFDTLFDETDPLVGPAGQLTIKEDPLRRIVSVETFVRMAGGDYFFLPSMPALKYMEGR